MWFKESLGEWSPEFILDWVKRNSSFNRIEPLGMDRDSQLPDQQFNYGRTLFACTRE